MATTALKTIADLEQIPGERWELVEGELREVPRPGGRHAKISARITNPLSTYLWDNDIGEIYVEGGFVLQLNPDTVLGPDIAAVLKHRLLPEEEEIGLMHQAPDLVVEIMSPGDRASEVLDKVMRYLNAGVAIVWVVDPERRRIVVWKADRTYQELHASDTLDGGELLPGFQLALAKVFR